MLNSGKDKEVCLLGHDFNISGVNIQRVNSTIPRWWWNHVPQFFLNSNNLG